MKSRGQICPILLRRKRTFSHGLENTHACKWILDNFPGIIHMSAFLENCQKSICMHGCSPIHVKRSFFFLKVWDRFVPIERTLLSTLWTTIQTQGYSRAVRDTQAGIMSDELSLIKAKEVRLSSMMKHLGSKGGNVSIVHMKRTHKMIWSFIMIPCTNKVFQGTGVTGVILKWIGVTWLTSTYAGCPTMILRTSVTSVKWTCSAAMRRLIIYVKSILIRQWISNARN